VIFSLLHRDFRTALLGITVLGTVFVTYLLLEKAGTRLCKYTLHIGESNFGECVLFVFKIIQFL